MTTTGKNQLFVKPKDRGLSFFADGDQIHFEVVAKGGEEATIIAESLEIAKQLAGEHYGGGNFRLSKTHWKWVQRHQKTDTAD